MCDERTLYLGGRNVLATPPDHVLEPSGQKGVAVLVAEAGVTRVQPAVLDGGRGDLGRVPVPRRHHRVAEAELADLARFDIAAFGVDDAQLVFEGMRRRLPCAPNTAGLQARGRALRTAERVLAHPVAGQDPDPESGFELITLRRRRSGRGVDRA